MPIGTKKNETMLTSQQRPSGPVHTKTIENANARKRIFFYAFRPSVHTKTMKTLTSVFVWTCENDDRFRVDGHKNMRLRAFSFSSVFVWTGPNSVVS